MKKALLLIVIFVSVLIGCSSNDDEINVDPINCEFQPFLGTSGNVVQLNGNSVLLNGSITVTSTEPNCENPLILSQGFVYSTSIQPTIDNVVKEVDGETITEIINDLETETEYFVRTFLSTETETYYGNQISFIVENFFVGDVNLNSQNEVDDFGNTIILNKN
tara:strand:+ start:152 stop:640 length:489 start_codon:yes stop_codon:yes gene_type:complete